MENMGTDPDGEGLRCVAPGTVSVNQRRGEAVGGSGEVARRKALQESILSAKVEQERAINERWAPRDSLVSIWKVDIWPGFANVRASTSRCSRL